MIFLIVNKNFSIKQHINILFSKINPLFYFEVKPASSVILLSCKIIVKFENYVLKPIVLFSSKLIISLLQILSTSTSENLIQRDDPRITNSWPVNKIVRNKPLWDNWAALGYIYLLKVFLKLNTREHLPLCWIVLKQKELVHSPSNLKNTLGLLVPKVHNQGLLMTKNNF